MAEPETSILFLIDAAKAEAPREPEHFSGSVTVQRLAALDDRTAIQAVFFEPGARTLPHIHVHDQVLLCVAGSGIVASDRIQALRPGMGIRIPAGTWHWHGATKESAMCHVAIHERDKGDRWDVERRDWADYREG